MDLKRIRSLWKSYQDHADQQYHYSPSELSDLLKEKTIPRPWYRPTQRILLQLSVSLFLLGLTGC